MVVGLLYGSNLVKEHKNSRENIFMKHDTISNKYIPVLRLKQGSAKMSVI